MPFEIDPDIAKASTPPTAFYRDPAMFDRTREALFARSWQFVGDCDMVKVPGQVHPVTYLEGMLEEPLLLTRDREDQIHCLSNVCTHRGNIVCEGPGVENSLRCRYHGRRFGLDGKFQFMPEFDGVEGFPCEADHLRPAAFDVLGKWIFSSLDPKSPFDEVFEPICEKVGFLPFDEFFAHPARTRDYMVKGHWALYCDNYLEGFHIPYIHADLNATLSYEDYRYELWDHGVLQVGVAKGDDTIFDLPVNHPDHGQRISAYYYWVFPNLMLNFYPWGLSINVVKPIRPDLTRVSFLGYVWREDIMWEGAGGALDRVEREDEAVVELVQKGIQSRFYDRGRYSPKREVGTHHFHRLLARHLAES
ncbi:MAG: aromatic ring-hydroxylating dioxygenase subunit alpha [Fimbriimonadaceae bacterium]|nr:aromatic ring-hydroxylating dioxygenase subunit alpha [Fimbriimonadaceae bacterium]